MDVTRRLTPGSARGNVISPRSGTLTASTARSVRTRSARGDVVSPRSGTLTASSVRTSSARGGRIRSAAVEQQVQAPLTPWERYGSTGNISEVPTVRAPSTPWWDRRHEDAGMSQAGRFSMRGLSGYCGHIPGKVANNVHGSSFRVDNERAAVEVHERRRKGPSGGIGQSAAGTSTSEFGHGPQKAEMLGTATVTHQPDPPPRTFGPRPGHEVPGYMGFVPGKYADNIMGQTEKRAAELAWMAKEQQMSERVQRVSAYRDGRPPGV